MGTRPIHGTQALILPFVAFAEALPRLPTDLNLVMFGAGTLWPKGGRSRRPYVARTPHRTA